MNFEAFALALSAGSYIEAVPRRLINALTPGFRPLHHENDQILRMCAPLISAKLPAITTEMCGKMSVDYFSSASLVSVLLHVPEFREEGLTVLDLLINTADEDNHYHVCCALGRAPGFVTERFRPRLIELLQSPSAMVQAAALTALSRMRAPEALSFAFLVLSEEAAITVLSSADFVLDNWPDRDCVLARLKSAIRENRLSTSGYLTAADSLACFGEEASDVVDDILAYLKTNGSSKNKASLSRVLLAISRDPLVIETSIAMMQGVLEAADEQRLPPIQSADYERIADPDIDAAVTLVTSFSTQGGMPPVLGDVIIRLILSKDWQLREAAVEAASWMMLGHNEILPALLQCLEDALNEGLCSSAGPPLLMDTAILTAMNSLVVSLEPALPLLRRYISTVDQFHDGLTLAEELILKISGY